MLVIWGGWFASVLFAIALVRPLMITKSDWFGLLLFLYLIPSAGAIFYLWAKVHRWFGLYCRNCGAAFVHIDGSDVVTDGGRLCSRCGSAIIDLEA